MQALEQQPQADFLQQEAEEEEEEEYDEEEEEEEEEEEQVSPGNATLCETTAGLADREKVLRTALVVRRPCVSLLTMYGVLVPHLRAADVVRLVRVP